MKRIILGVAASLALITAAAAQPVAVVEEVRGKVTGAEFMDYVSPKQVIKLGPNSAIVLSYIKSCRRETITGVGTVIVGEAESMVHLGEVKGAKVECDSEHLQLKDRQVSETAATVVRSIAQQLELKPQVTLHGLSPIIETRARGTLALERLDQPAARLTIELAPAGFVRGKFFDLARVNAALAPGATYEASLGGHKTTFMIDPQAKAGAGPIVGRLLRLD